MAKREDHTCEQGVSSPAWHKPLALAVGKWPGLGQTEIKEMQAREDREECQGKTNVRAQTEELSVQIQGGHHNCHHTLSRNLMP